MAHPLQQTIQAVRRRARGHLGVQGGAERHLGRELRRERDAELDLLVFSPVALSLTVPEPSTALLLAPALLALEARLVLASVDGDREVALADFFTGYRETVLRPAELVRSVRVPTPLAAGARVFENPDAPPLAAIGDEVVWRRDGTGFAGASRTDRAVLRVSYSQGWQPEPELEDWFTTVSAAEGEARFEAGGYLRWAPYLAAALVFLALGMIVAGRLRR